MKSRFYRVVSRLQKVYKIEIINKTEIINNIEIINKTEIINKIKTQQNRYSTVFEPLPFHQKTIPAPPCSNERHWPKWPFPTLSTSSWFPPFEHMDTHDRCTNDSDWVRVWVLNSHHLWEKWKLVVHYMATWLVYL